MAGAHQIKFLIRNLSYTVCTVPPASTQPYSPSARCNVYNGSPPPNLMKFTTLVRSIPLYTFYYGQLTTFPDLGERKRCLFRQYRYPLRHVLEQVFVELTTLSVLRVNRTVPVQNIFFWKILAITGIILGRLTFETSFSFI